MKLSTRKTKEERMEDSQYQLISKPALCENKEALVNGPL